MLDYIPFVLLAVSAAKDAAGNIDLQKLQQIKQVGDSLAEELSKKED